MNVRVLLAMLLSALTVTVGACRRTESDDTGKHSPDPPPDAMEARNAGRLSQSLMNLEQIGLAMHNFHNRYKRFPPAVVYGPDGKPWHSWRVLLLPFVEQAALYDRYRFDEPWDGPNNKALLDSIPAVYRDPAYSGSNDPYTHYAAITGSGTAFPLEPLNPTDFGPFRPGSSAARASLADLRDGDTNTILVGSVSPARKIPWMKPEDLAWHEEFAGIGKPDGFAVPHKVGQQMAGVFLFGDASAKAIRDDLDLGTLRKLVEIADGQPVFTLPEVLPRPGRDMIPRVPPPVAARPQSINNLKSIGLAMHNFHDRYKRFPPAVVYGPDGKPWHSWRVLILPYIDQRLYDRYRFDEPWDGPHNKALLKSVPAAYRDPVYPESKDGFTHYAAITGPGTAFPLEPRHPVDFARNVAGLTAATTTIADIRDGTSNTILVGPVSPERKIPWTKPEDVAWNDNFPALGRPGSFATPHQSDNRPAAAFVRADGSVLTERADLDLTALRRLLRIADGP